jgi:hypothetical protein
MLEQDFQLQLLRKSSLQECGILCRWNGFFLCITARCILAGECAMHVLVTTGIVEVTNTDVVEQWQQ